MSPQLHSPPGNESEAYRWKALDISFRSPPVASFPRWGVTHFPHFPHFPHESVAAYVKIEYFATRFGVCLIRTFCRDCAKSERPCNLWGRRKPARRPTSTYFGERLGQKLRKSRVPKSFKIIPNHVIWSLRVILRHISDFEEFTPLGIYYASASFYGVPYPLHIPPAGLCVCHCDRHAPRHLGQERGLAGVAESVRHCGPGQDRCVVREGGGRGEMCVMSESHMQAGKHCPSVPFRWGTSPAIPSDATPPCSNSQAPSQPARSPSPTLCEYTAAHCPAAAGAAATRLRSLIQRRPAHRAIPHHPSSNPRCPPPPPLPPPPRAPRTVAPGSRSLPTAAAIAAAAAAVAAGPHLVAPEPSHWAAAELGLVSRWARPEPYHGRDSRMLVWIQAAAEGMRSFPAATTTPSSVPRRCSIAWRCLALPTTPCPVRWCRRPLLPLLLLLAQRGWRRGRQKCRSPCLSRCVILLVLNSLLCYAVMTGAPLSHRL